MPTLVVGLILDSKADRRLVGLVFKEAAEDRKQEDTVVAKDSFCTSTYAAQMHLAEGEVSAFIAAVTKSFGPEQARLSAED